MRSRLSRRSYLKTAAAAVGSAMVLPAGLARGYAANEKIHIGVIGAGGRGHANMMACAGENIVALCDVDENRLSRAAARFPRARKHVDFRKLLETEKDLDAAVVSTPDHCHAPASVMAMKRGLHVYCEKPLTHSVHEARVMTTVAANEKVVTQMGTQFSCFEHNFRTVELLQAGAIGPVREVHVWVGNPLWPQGQDRPEGEDPVPRHLHWNEWIGPAPMRPFKDTYTGGPLQGKPVYHPFVWRGWWDFGTGLLGDGCCHQCNVVFWALNLGSPTSVEAESSGMPSESFPEWSIIRYQFPGEGDQPTVKLIWYEGGKMPPPEVLPEGKVSSGSPLFIGEKGQLYCNPPMLFPRKSFADYEPPEPTIPRRTEVHEDWLQAIKNGTQPGCHFGHAGPMAEALLLGNVALKVGRKIEWDAAKLEVTNCPEANRFIRREYREGWGV
jgi:hypothetical protein